MTTLIPNLALEQIREELHTALRQWVTPSSTQPVFEDLVLLQKLLRQATGKPQAIDRLLTNLLATLETRNERFARILRLRFVDNFKAETVAHKEDMAPATFYNMQRNAIDQAAELLMEQELAARTTHRLAMEHLLEPPTYTALIGVDALLDQLLAQLLQPTEPWLFALEGMGGLGKTSLANALMRRLIANPAPFINIGWVTARQSHFDPIGTIVAETRPVLTGSALVEALWQQLIAPELAESTVSHDQRSAMLHTRLREQPHLIVIDNLETLADVHELLPLLQKFQNPTKFLLTSRERVGGMGIFHFAVPALSADHTLRLVRQEAVWANLPSLADASDAELRPIYTTVGGNPLALRLIVGQTHTQPLSAILEDLVAKRGSKVEQFYTYLYRRAWEQLDESSRDLWLALPLVTAGRATVTHLARQTKLDQQVVHTAIDHLATLNLINCHGDLHERYFTIHNLTRTFLLNRIARWGG